MPRPSGCARSWPFGGVIRWNWPSRRGKRLKVSSLRTRVSSPGLCPPFRAPLPADAGYRGPRAARGRATPWGAAPNPALAVRHTPGMCSLRPSSPALPGASLVRAPIKGRAYGPRALPSSPVRCSPAAALRVRLPGGFRASLDGLRAETRQLRRPRLPGQSRFRVRHAGPGGTMPGLI